MSTNQEASTQKRIPANVFLSYASEDRKHAVWLRDRLRGAGLDNVWLDIAEIDGGENWKQEINLGLRKVSMLVALCTKSSVDPSRTVIMHEWKEATRLLINARLNARRERYSCVRRTRTTRTGGDAPGSPGRESGKINPRLVTWLRKMHFESLLIGKPLFSLQQREQRCRAHLTGNH